MRVHDFQSALQRGQVHERHLDAAFIARGWEVTPATHAEQLAGIDRHMVKDGAARTVEYKADERSDETGNYALELVASIPDAGAAKWGWAVAPGADWVVLYRPKKQAASLLRKETLTRMARRALAAGGRVVTVRNASWTTLCLLVPCIDVDGCAEQRLAVAP